MSDEKAGLLSSLMYVVVMMGLGLPVWWKTTEVYRVNLPYGEIEDLRSNLQLKVNLQLVTTDTKKDQQWGPQMQSHLQGNFKHYRPFSKKQK